MWCSVHFVNIHFRPSHISRLTFELSHNPHFTKLLHSNNHQNPSIINFISQSINSISPSINSPSSRHPQSPCSLSTLSPFAIAAPPLLLRSRWPLKALLLSSPLALPLAWRPVSSSFLFEATLPPTVP